MCDHWRKSSSPNAKVCSCCLRFLAHSTHSWAGRDAPSSYKLLATSVRNLRNGLEEVEEDYDPTRTLGPDDVRLLDQISRSHDILSRLDLALQSYKSSTHKDVNMNAVSDLKTALDVSTHQLKLAFEATTTGEIPLKLDTGDFPDPPNPSASIEDSSASRSRKSSVWSLGHKDSPRSPGASDATSVHNERMDRLPEEEKEALSPSVSSASEARASMDWRSPFSDPLSMPIDDATSFILGGDDDLSMTSFARPVSSRSRAESNVSAATETFVSAPASPEMERKPSASNAESTSADTSVARDAADGASVQSSDTATGADNVTEQPESRPSSSAKPEAWHLSPETATRELALKRTRSNSNPSRTEDAKAGGVTLVPGTSKESPTIREPPSDGSVSRLSSSHQTAPNAQPTLQDTPSAQTRPSSTGSLPAAATSPAPPPESRAQTYPPAAAAPAGGNSGTQNESAEDFAKDLSKSMEAVLAGGQQESEPKPVIASPPLATPPSEATTQHDPASPPQPARRPPPPPPIRRSKPKAKSKPPQSKYRITNEAPDESSSEDELYTSSRPSSPGKVKSPVVQSPHLVTPTIQIDQSALDDAEKGDKARPVPAVAEDEEAKKGSEVAPRLPATVSKSPSTTKPPIFARKKSSDSEGQQTVEPTKQGVQTVKTPQSPPVTGSPKSRTSPQRSQSPQSPPLPPSVQKRVGAAVKAGDKLLAKEIEVRVEREEGKPPPIPPRPKSRYNNRPRAATTLSSPAVLVEKEIAAESGLELSDQLRASKPSLSPRVSVDHALNVRARDSILAPEPAASLEGTRHSRSATTSQLPPPQFAQGRQQSQSASGTDAHRLTGWYGPGADDTSPSDLDLARIEHICHFWNNMAWDYAQEYLIGYLESSIEQDNMAVARRVRHLLAICAAFKGDTEHAITMFLSVLEISEPSDLAKLGNCEACYWLGDLYAMQNQRLEALLAYCAAQWGDLFNDPEEPNLCELIKAEQEAVQLGSPKSDFKVRWSQEAKEGCGSILDPKILPQAVVKHLFEVEPRRDAGHSFPNLDNPFQLDPNKPRSSAFFSVSSSPQINKFRRSKIGPEHFISSGPWPLQYDPTFAMANVKRERLLGYECDLLTVLQSNNGEAKIPKTGPMSLSRMDCFTCGDLPWLITSVRACLKMLEMDWSEVANEQGVWFVVRHTLMDGPMYNSKMKMATVHYFAISLFKQSFRSSYGVEICSHGVSSARIMEPSNLEYERGVHHSEAKRIKKLIRETLEEAEKRRPKSKKRQSSMGLSSVGLGISRLSGDDQSVKSPEEMKPPPIPPRPKKADSSGS